MISKLELRRARLLKHCMAKKSSNEPTLNKSDFVGSTEPFMKNLHYVRNLPGDLIFCLLKKGGSTSLTNFFTNNLDPTDEVGWLEGLDKETQEQIVLSRSSLRVMLIRHPFTRLVSAFNHLFRWGLQEEGSFSCANTTNFVRDCETPNSALAKNIIKQTRPGSNDTLLQFPEFVRFLIDRGNEFKWLKDQVMEDWSALADHWQPFSSDCAPCTLLPHLILELNTLSEELPFVLEWSGLARVYGQFPILPKQNKKQVGTSFVSLCFCLSVCL